MANGPRKPMRQGQQNRRGRGRGRKPQNPMGRNLESNGPEVKIRGNAAHIAEKYATLARDALASGDMVAGESYLQHAEHYNRIIMASQAQQAAQNQQASPNQQTDSHGDNMNGAERGRNNGPDEDSKGKQPEVAAEGNGAGAAPQDAPSQDASAQRASGRNSDAEKPAKRSAKSGNGADDSGQSESVAKPKKEETSEAKDTDESKAGKNPDKAVS